jgi:hypothetical protein
MRKRTHDTTQKRRSLTRLSHPHLRPVRLFSQRCSQKQYRYQCKRKKRGTQHYAEHKVFLVPGHYEDHGDHRGASGRHQGQQKGQVVPSLSLGPINASILGAR